MFIREDRQRTGLRIGFTLKVCIDLNSEEENFPLKNGMEKSRVK